MINDSGSVITDISRLNMKLSPRSIKLILMCLVSVIFCFGGVAILWAGYDCYNVGQQSKNWPSANGIVTQSRVNLYRTSQGNEYRADIEYQFKVKDQTHTSDRINLGYKSSNKLDGIAHELVDTYFVGRHVQVFYDPRDPDSAMLETGIHWTTYLSFAGGLFVVFLSLFFGRWFIMELRRPGSVFLS